MPFQGGTHYGKALSTLLKISEKLHNFPKTFDLKKCISFLNYVYSLSVCW